MQSWLAMSARALVVCGMLVGSGCVTGFKGTTTASARLDLKQNRVALMYESAQADQAELRFLAHLNDAFIQQGYTVIERLHYPRVLADFMEISGRSESGTNSIGGAGWNAQSFSTSSIYGFSPRDIIKIGHYYKLDYLVVYARLSGNLCTLRLVDCKTAEVVATTTMNAFTPGQPTYGEQPIAQLLVLSLKYAAGYTNAKGDARPVYLDITPQKKTVSVFTGIDRIFYQEPLIPSSRNQGPYAVIYSMGQGPR